LKELLIDKIKKAKDIEKMIENWWKEKHPVKGAFFLGKQWIYLWCFL
jgi:hypothetical protein